MNTVNGTVQQQGSRRRVVRRSRPALEQVHGTNLADLPIEIRPLVIECAEIMRAGTKIHPAPIVGIFQTLAEDSKPCA